MTLVLGVDENGLGPRLGPLVVTAVAIEAEPGAEKAAFGRASRLGRALAKRLGDSKALVHYGESSLGESWARALASHLGWATPANPDELLHAMLLDGREVLRKRCPDDHENQCWGIDDEHFTSNDESVATAHADIQRLAKHGLHVRALRLAVICTERINEAAARGVSRFMVDLHAMERLTLTLREELGRDLTAICGKVGGYNQYSDAFGPLGGRLHVVMEEGRKRSEYRFPGLGTMAFVRDADDSHLVVSLASLVGKWARDMLMNRIVRHHRKDVPDVPDCSGYHDPTTTKFVEATALVRKKRRLPDDCFERRAVEA